MTVTHKTSSAVLNTQIEAMQTVPPYKVTDPRQVWKLSGKHPIGSWIFNNAFNVVLFFNKATNGEDSGWLTAGWIKESLGKALRDEPMLSGRLRRSDGDGEFEVVANDSGARLFEATADITLQDFLEISGGVEMAESKLVFWKDIDHQNPQFSPLFYVKVTNFKCGGYSVGISCSVVIADIVIIDNFLQKWTKIHKDILPKNNQNILPTFYLPSLKPPSVNLNSLFPSTTRPKTTQTLIFKITPPTNQNLVDFKDNNLNLASFCLEKAQNELGITKTATDFDILEKESKKEMKARNCKISEIGESPMENEITMLKSSKLRESLEVSFREGSKPEKVSYWMSGEVQAIAIPSYDSADLNIILTIPFDN